MPTQTETKQSKPKKRKKKEFVNEFTGEVFDNEKDYKASLKEEIRVCDDNIAVEKNRRKKIKEASGENIEKLIKRDGYFYKVWKIDQSILYHLSASARELLLLLIFNMNHEDNKVRINDKIISNKEMQELFKIPKNRFNESIKELEDNRLIKTVKSKYRMIIINPYLVTDSLTKESIYKMFEPL